MTALKRVMYSYWPLIFGIVMYLAFGMWLAR